MKFLLPLFILVGAFSVHAQSEGIIWEKDFKQAQQIARETGRPMLIDFSASWCKPCQMMEKEFWTRSDVADALKPFVAVKVDFDNDKGLASRYGVAAIPFVIFADPLGNLVTFRRGFSPKNTQELSEIFKEMPKDFSSMLKLYDALDAKKDDGATLLQIADAYRNRNLIALSSSYYEKTLKTNEFKTDGEKKSRILLTLGANYIIIKQYKKSLEALDDLQKLNPAGSNRETMLYLLIYASAYENKAKDANKYLQILQTEFPSSTNIEKAKTAMENAKNLKNSPKN